MVLQTLLPVFMSCERVRIYCWEAPRVRPLYGYAWRLNEIISLLTDVWAYHGGGRLGKIPGKVPHLLTRLITLGYFSQGSRTGVGCVPLALGSPLHIKVSAV